MKLKKILIIFLLIFLPILIYITNIDKKVYYLALGDSLALGQNPYGSVNYGYSDYTKDYLRKKGILEFYTKKYSVGNHRTTDLIRDINDNKKIIEKGKEITIKNALTKADVITLSIGSNDIYYKISMTSVDYLFDNSKELKKYIDGVLKDINKLILLIKKYCNEDIIITGYYNPLWHINSDYSQVLEPIFLYANKELKKIAIKNDIYFLDIDSIIKKNSDYIPNPLDIHPSTEGYKAISKEIIKIIEEEILD